MTRAPRTVCSGEARLDAKQNRNRCTYLLQLFLGTYMYRSVLYHTDMDVLRGRTAGAIVLDVPLSSGYIYRYL